MSTFKLDSLDQTILTLLSCQEGLSTAHIARHINLSTRATRTRLLKLITQNLIEEKGSNLKDPTKKYFCRLSQNALPNKSSSLKNQKLIEFNLKINSELAKKCDILKDLGISTFIYQRFTNNDQYFMVSNNINWGKYHLHNICNFNKTFQQKMFHSKNDAYTYTLWPSEPTDPLLTSFYNFNIWNGITISSVSIKNSSMEIFSFATTRENKHIINIYFNNLTLLTRFIHVFKEHMSFNDTSFLSNSITLKNPLSFEDSSTQFFCKMPQNKYPILNKHNQEVTLSHREKECLKYLSQGKNIKKIAQTLSLSPRTVESYLNNTKIKLECTCKSDLTDLYLKSMGIS